MDIIYPREFYARPTLEVVRDLLGARLVRILDEVRLSGVITEVEAYVGEQDLGCHARAGLTRRTAVMYGSPGHAYIYFTYGMHWMLNAVTEPEGLPAAVLIRAIEPQEGRENIALRRNGRDTRGPAKLTRGLGIDGSLNGVDLCGQAGRLWIETGEPVPDCQVVTGPRIGLFTVPEPWKSMRWNFAWQRR